jgi:hypothetical protein
MMHLRNKITILSTKSIAARNELTGDKAGYG